MQKRVNSIALAMVLAQGLVSSGWAAEPAPQSAIDACSEEAKKAHVISEELATFINVCLTDAGYATINVNVKGDDSAKSSDGKG